ncbi:TPA: hypothetical protein ON711_003483 [Citrobacter freundii]|nr:hypothetical protein [Citrobacter freundii]MDK5878876.1 hypothetical protein [Citrobacter freundii]HCR3766306.1 hypothetical protein [Citrobacter freundii]
MERLAVALNSMIISRLEQSAGKLIIKNQLVASDNTAFRATAFPARSLWRLITVTGVFSSAIDSLFNSRNEARTMDCDWRLSYLSDMKDENQLHFFLSYYD